MYDSSKQQDQVVDKLYRLVLQQEEIENEKIDQLLFQFDEKQEQQSEKPKWFSN